MKENQRSIKGKPAGKGKWLALGVTAFAAFLAVETGWAGYGFAHLKAAVYPSDTGLLGWIPATTETVVIVDPHQVDLKALGAEGDTARTAISRIRDDVKRASGVDLAFDVDKLVITPSLVAARGRFDAKKLTELLTSRSYALAERKGEVYLVRAGEDAIGVVGGSVLLYGDEASLTAAIDAHDAGTSLEKSDPTKARLAQVGWNHPLLATHRITDEQPSLRAILSGATGPRAVTVGVSTRQSQERGIDVDAVVESASPAAAAELAKLLDEQRQKVDGLAPIVGADLASVLADIAKKSTLAADPKDSGVRAHVHLDPAQIAALGKSTRSSVPVAQWYKALRLFQLLAPGG
jgi:hypothetical protein